MAPEPTSKAIVGYCRVSTERQAEEGVSMEAQLAKIRAYAELNNLELRRPDGTDRVHLDEGISGSTIHKRPGVRAAIEEAVAEKGVLFVYSLSRLSRSTHDAIAIMDRLGKAGADLVSFTEKIDTTTAAGRLFFTMIAGFAEFERRQTGERTKSALRHKVDVGEAVGSVPYGFRKVAADGRPAAGKRDKDIEKEPRRLVVVPEEAEVLLRIHRRLAKGHGYGRIARDLEADEVTSRAAGGWDRGYIRRLVRYYSSPDSAGLRTLLRAHMGYVIFESPALASAAAETPDEQENPQEDGEEQAREQAGEARGEQAA